jgi:hypothetical protein
MKSDKKITNQYLVEISDIEVNDNYFKFKYKIFINNYLSVDEEYDGDHSWSDDKEGFIKILESGHAAQLALETI